MNCLILAGGLGTRLQAAVPNLPKCLAPVQGRPFLYWMIQMLHSKGIRQFTLSLGYQREKIEVLPNGKTFRTYVRLSYSTSDLKRIMTKEIQKNEVLNTKIRRTKAFEELEKEIELSREAKTKNRSRQDAE
jgi:UTP-glucose-1-phosphate uridylyltransferase